MSNLNLMIGDWVNYGIENVKVFHIDKDEDRVRINYIGSDLYQPIPLSTEIMEKIEGMEKNKFLDYKEYIHPYGDRLFVISNNQIVDYGSNLTLLYLHQLQQLIRLFTNKEIEIKWD
jgi:hypothetical protein